MADRLDQHQDVLDSVNLVREYREKSAVKQYVNERFVYKNQHYVFFNFALLQQFAPEFKPIYQRIFGGKPVGKKRYWNQDDIRFQIGKFIDHCYSSKDVLDRVEQQTIDYYTRDLNLSGAEKAALRQTGAIQFFKNQKRKQAGEEKGIEGAKLKPEELDLQRKIANAQNVPEPEKIHRLAEDEEKRKVEELLGVQPEQRGGLVDTQGRPLTGESFSDLGQPLPSAPPSSSDLEVIHATPEVPTARQAHVPIENIRDRARVISTQARQIFRPVAKEATSQAEIAIIRGKPRAANFIIRSLGSISRGIISLPFGAEAGSVTRGAGSIRMVGIGARGTGGLLARGAGGLLARGGLALLAAGGWWLLLIPLALFALPVVFQLMRSNAPCMPDGCRYAGPVSDNSLLTLSKTGTDRVQAGQDIRYTISVTYLGTGTASAEISDKIPDGTQFKATDGTYDDRTNTVKWNLSDLAPNRAKLLSLTVVPTRDKFWAVNQASALFRTFPIISGGNEPPNNDNCGGKYSPQNVWLKSPLRNFGDPACSMTKDALAQQLKQLDPEYAYWWFNELIPCESDPDYNPNSYNPGSPDSAGAWGLYQMGRGLNGQYDHGDVPWQQQTSNAITYKNNRVKAGLSPFAYWECSYPKYFPPYKRPLP